MGLFRTIGRALGYDAVNAKNKRQAPTGILRTEDQELTPDERRKLLSAARDINRNFALAAWMVRKHLDYVSTFTFQAKTGNERIDTLLEKFVRGWSHKRRCDVAGRHGLARLVRLLEARRTLDGDAFLVRIADGRLQALEGDRIRTPTGGLPPGVKRGELTHGVLLDQFGGARAYCLCRRGRASDMQPGGGEFHFERLLSAENVWQHAYFDRIDQVRGISPVASAVNTLRDTYEGFDYALAKMKVSQLFGLALFREKDDQVGEVEESDDGKLTVDFGRGPVLFDLDQNDKAEFLESKSPSFEFQAWAQVMLGVALKALDIPYSFYAENFTNFSGQRQAWIQYDLSARNKRADNRDLLDEVTAWRVRLAIEDGELPDFDVEAMPWEWISVGVPWIDPLKEVQADVQAIGAGLSSRTRVLRERGLDFYEVADELKAEQEYLEKLGLPTDVEPQNTQIVEIAGG
jgi:capsid protein